MPEKFNPSDLTPKLIAKHLRQPDGEIGKQVGLEMNKSNQYICMNSYKLLEVEDGNHVLEIGMGNGFFVKDLLQMAAKIHYSGVDFSPTMVAEAKEMNQNFMETGQVDFKQASIEKLPFEDNCFDCITSTNTLYFWPKPTENVRELLRVLKPGGKLLLAYRSKACMDQLEIAKHGFEKYEHQDVEHLLSNAGFKELNTQTIKEPQLEFDGKAFQIEGIYTTGIK